MGIFWIIKRTAFSVLILLIICGYSQSESLNKKHTKQTHFLVDSITSHWINLTPDDKPFQTKEAFLSSIRNFDRSPLELTDLILKQLLVSEDSYGKVMLMTKLTNVYRSYGLTHQSLDLINTTIEAADRLKYPILPARLFVIKAFILYKDLKRDSHEALSLLLDALDIHKKVGNRGGELNLSKILADYHLTYGDINKAKDLFQQVIDEGEGIVKRVTIVDSWNGIGLIHQKKGKYQEALHYFNKALELAAENKMNVWVNLLRGNIGDTYFLMGRFEDAIPLLKDDLTTSQEFKINENLSKIHKNLGEIYLNLNQMDKAEVHLNEALKEAKRNRQYYILADVYRLLGERYAQVNQNAISMNFHLKSLYLKDSLHSLNNSVATRIAEINRIYDLRNKEQEEARLIKENTLKSIVIEKQKFWVIAIILVALIISGFLFVLYNIIKKRKIVNQKLNEQYDVIVTQKEQIEQFNSKLEKEIVLRTQELSKMNRELHEYAFMNSHNVRGPLASILGLFYILKHKLHYSGEEKEIINKATHEAEKMDRIISQISRKLESSWKTS